MCGICGFAETNPQRPVDAVALETMNNALRHRGPDDAGCWIGEQVGLAMRRLSIQDVAGGHQPLTNENNTVIVVFNGEIYNFLELREDLIARGHQFATRSDTEVIVHAYEEYGDDAINRFNGMFAFALYDIPRGRLLIARDHIGIKPLFYTWHNGTLAFASELDALLQSGRVQGSINPAALDAYFTFLYVPAPDSIFTGVQKLRPGEKLVLERGNLTVERYWKLRFAPARSWTPGSASEVYRALLTDAVRHQRISDVPLGAFLSGGIDSSSVVAALSELSSHPVKTFTIGFDDADMDEMRYARIAAQAFGTDHTEAVLSPDLAEWASGIARHFGEPFADSSAAPTWLVSQLAREQVTVVLSGDGGDELFAGYTWLHQARRAAMLGRVPAFIRHGVAGILNMMPPSPRIGKLQRFVADSFLTPMGAFRRRETCLGPEARAELYTPETRRAVEQAREDRFAEHAAEAAAWSPENAMLYTDTLMYLPDDILTKVDRMSMAHALEARVPLLDRRIVEFAATVPFGLKWKHGVSKRLVKDAMRRVLPPELLKQRKQGFAIPVQRWFRTGRLHDHFRETVLGPDARLTRFMRREPIVHWFSEQTAGRAHHGHALWTFLMFEHWLRYAESHVQVEMGGRG